MKFKSLMCAFLTTVCVGAGMSAMAEEDVVSVYVDNEKVEFADQSPLILDGTTLVPIRAVFEKAGATVTWNQEEKTATLVKGDYTVKITVGDSVLYKNDVEVPLTVSALIYNSRILIPVRAIGEAMDFDINWDGFHSSVHVGTDGTEYRPYAARKVAFRELSEAAVFYSDKTVEGENVDITNAEIDEYVTFTRTLDAPSEVNPLLTIDGVDYSDALRSMRGTYALAVVDIDRNDTTKEIVVVETGDTLTAWFFSYDGEKLTPITKGGSQAKIVFASKLFFDQRSYMLSDLEGLCFTDIMLTGSAYQLENNVITQYRVSNAEKMIPRTLVHTYNDSMIYHYTPTDTFVPGGYKDGSKFTMEALEFDSFVVLDMYVDETNPSYIEVYEEFPNGIRAVLSPFGA